MNQLRTVSLWSVIIIGCIGILQFIQKPIHKPIQKPIQKPQWINTSTSSSSIQNPIQITKNSSAGELIMATIPFDHEENICDEPNVTFQKTCKLFVTEATTYDQFTRLLSRLRVHADQVHTHPESGTLSVNWSIRDTLVSFVQYEHLHSLINSDATCKLTDNEIIQWIVDKFQLDRIKFQLDRINRLGLFIVDIAMYNCVVGKIPTEVYWQSLCKKMNRFGSIQWPKEWVNVDINNYQQIRQCFGSMVYYSFKVVPTEDIPKLSIVLIAHWVICKTNSNRVNLARLMNQWNQFWPE